MTLVISNVGEAVRHEVLLIRNLGGRVPFDSIDAPGGPLDIIRFRRYTAVVKSRRPEALRIYKKGGANNECAVT